MDKNKSHKTKQKRNIKKGSRATGRELLPLHARQLN